MLLDVSGIAWESDCCLLTSEHLAISWREQVTFNRMMTMSALFDIL
jgi:hypothetical protein